MVKGREERRSQPEVSGFEGDTAPLLGDFQQDVSDRADPGTVCNTVTLLDI